MALLVAPRAWSLPPDVPDSYNLRDVSIEYSYFSGWSGRRQLRLGGDGTGLHATRSRGDSTSVAVQVSPTEVLRLLKMCYECSFFDYRSSYTVRESIFANSANDVTLTIGEAEDAASWRMKVSIRQYEKVVSFRRRPRGSAPAELEALADSVEAVGRRLGIEMRR